MSDAMPAVLLVDDDIDICANMADILADLGYAVDVAHEGTAALELVRRRPYDVALLDLKMPGMDGVSLCREIRRVRSGTVALLVTAYAGGDVARDALDAGVWQVLSKPVDFPRLIGLIEEATGQPLVLVVDDDPDLCANLRDLLHGRGYRVCIAHDEDEAVDRLRETTRVVLLDLRLAGGDGGVVFRRVREINPVVRVVLITGYPEEMGPLAERLNIEGADDLLPKPLDISRLLEALRRLAARE
jgi:CheY-like chemotaxis protein